MKVLKFLPSLLIVLWHTTSCADAAKILSVAFASSKSHYIAYAPIHDALASRGHHLTIISAFVSGHTRSNVREIKAASWEARLDGLENAFELRAHGGHPFTPAVLFKPTYDTCAEAYDKPAIRALLDERFDAVIVFSMFNECASGFVYKLNTTIVRVISVPLPSFVGAPFGNPAPTSFVPHMYTDYSDRMNLYQRTVNFIVDTIVMGFSKFKGQPAMAALYREKLGDPSIPLHDEIMRNASLILATSHPALSKPMPLLPDIVEVGGLHCGPAKPLPKELDQFLSGSGPDGFILFSMGSVLKAKAMPENYRRIFINAFGRLKQRVLWKWETEHMEDLPPNVKLSKWVPQQDVLGHPKIRAFLTHGGLGGATEAAYHAVPLIGIPMFAEQFKNLRKLEDAGLAVGLDFGTLTEDGLVDAINRVLTNASYADNAQKLSRIFRDQPDHPLDRAVFWIEYVIRHKGATHLRSAARDLNWLAYHSIDVLVVWILIIVIVAYILVVIIRSVVRVVRRTCKSLFKRELAMSKKFN